MINGLDYGEISPLARFRGFLSLSPYGEVKELKLRCLQEENGIKKKERERENPE